MAAKKLRPVHPGDILLHDFMQPLKLSSYKWQRNSALPRQRSMRLCGVAGRREGMLVGRVCWRLCRRGPGVGITDARWLRAVARVAHGTLYVLLLVVTPLGWAAASARGWRVAFFDHLALPALLPLGSAAASLAGDAHGFLAYLLLALLVFHVSAALYHRFILHDEVLARMLPNGRRPPRGYR